MMRVFVSPERRSSLEWDGGRGSLSDYVTCLESTVCMDSLNVLTGPLCSHGRT